MTLLDTPKAMPDVDEAQLLFQEARDRRRRRWIFSGISAVVVVVILVATLGIVFGTSGGNRPTKPAAPPNAVPAAVGTASTISFRPVLCYAPALTLATGQSAKEGPLPYCSTASALTATNLNDNTSTGESTNPPPDPQFSSYASTPARSADTAGTVLLPGATGQSASRFVLGPVGMTQQGIKSARAVHVVGSWVVDLSLSSAGAVQWDTLAHGQFHALIAVVLNNRVISAPIVQPLQTAFSSFSGHFEIGPGFDESQAKAIAASL